MFTMSTKEVVAAVLAAAPPRLRERCDFAKIVAILQEEYGVYDAMTLSSVLLVSFVVVAARLEEQSAAPLGLVAIMKQHVCMYDQAAADAGGGGGGGSPAGVPTAGSASAMEQRIAPLSASGGKQVIVVRARSSHFLRLLHLLRPLMCPVGTRLSL